MDGWGCTPGDRFGTPPKSTTRWTFQLGFELIFALSCGRGYTELADHDKYLVFLNVCMNVWMYVSMYRIVMSVCTLDVLNCYVCLYFGCSELLCMFVIWMFRIVNCYVCLYFGCLFSKTKINIEIQTSIHTNIQTTKTIHNSDFSTEQIQVRPSFYVCKPYWLDKTHAKIHTWTRNEMCKVFKKATAGHTFQNP